MVGTNHDTPPDITGVDSGQSTAPPLTTRMSASCTSRGADGTNCTVGGHRVRAAAGDDDAATARGGATTVTFATSRSQTSLTAFGVEDDDRDLPWPTTTAASRSAAESEGGETSTTNNHDETTANATARRPSSRSSSRYFSLQSDWCNDDISVPSTISSEGGGDAEDAATGADVEAGAHAAGGAVRQPGVYHYPQRPTSAEVVAAELETTDPSTHSFPAFVVDDDDDDRRSETSDIEASSNASPNDDDAPPPKASIDRAVLEQMVRDAPLVDGVSIPPEESRGWGRGDRPTIREGCTNTMPCTSSAVWLACLVALVAAIATVGIVITKERGSSAFLPESSAETNERDHERYAQIRDVLATVSGGAVFLSSTPQNRAASWLAYDDAERISPKNDEGRLIQRYVAALLLFSTKDSSVYHYRPLDEIMRGHECTWYVDLSPTFTWGLPGGMSCAESDDDDVITSIFLGQVFHPLVGTFPHEIGQLHQLRHLVLSDNQELVGPIPKSISSLSQLVRVNVALTSLSGTMPSFGASASSLRSLIFSRSSLTGTIPEDIGSLSRLVTLVVTGSGEGGSGSGITGTIPDGVADLTELSVLDLATNHLTGSIPSQLGRSMDLSFFSVVGNELSGTIPSGLMASGDLLALCMSGNKLTGTLSKELGVLKNLTHLLLDSNSLTSSIPYELGNDINLKYLELGHNQLTGQIPSSLENLVHLESLSLDGNDLTGDTNYLCDEPFIANLLTDCPASNPNLKCECCKCCPHDSTCGQRPKATLLTRNFFFVECCANKRCGKETCTGELL